MILLVRHGETDGNRTKTLQVPSLPLNANGLQQAAKMGVRVAKQFDVHRILCSDLQRTQDTAAAISREAGVSVELTSLLQERSFGDLRGQTFSSLVAQGISPLVPAYAPPNGEDQEAFRVRCDKAWEFVAEAAVSVPPGKVLVIVSHGLVLNDFAKKHVQIGPDEQAVTIIPFSNTSITLIDPEGDARTPSPVVGGLFNDDSHLSDEDRDPTFGKFLAKV